MILHDVVSSVISSLSFHLLELTVDSQRTFSNAFLWSCSYFSHQSACFLSLAKPACIIENKHSCIARLNADPRVVQQRCVWTRAPSWLSENLLQKLWDANCRVSRKLVAYNGCSRWLARSEVPPGIWNCRWCPMAVKYQLATQARIVIIREPTGKSVQDISETQRFNW